MKNIPTSALALSLLIAAAPFAAFAEDSGASVNVSANAQVQSSTSGSHDGASDNSGPDKGGIIKISDDLKGLFGAGAVRAHVEANHEASTSDIHANLHAGANASTTPRAPHPTANGAQARARGDAEVDGRIANLTKMIARLGDAQRLSSDAKASLTASLNAQIASLTNLKTDIDTGASTTLKTDDQSITKDFRVYALVMPQAAINAASDRIMTLVADMQALSAKISTRISAASAAGADVTAATAAHTDFDAKVADASVQAQAAVSEVVNLKPDNGDTTILASNTASLKDAKTKIDAAQADLKAARADLATILKGVKGKGEVKAGASASTTAQ
ncbi:MAG: hypothetical protein JWM39_340 [Parcubacteria group bacterium]|nr:hypothetical protein [Parcubacteria group bacterium]